MHWHLHLHAGPHPAPAGDVARCLGSLRNDPWAPGAAEWVGYQAYRLRAVRGAVAWCVTDSVRRSLCRVAHVRSASFPERDRVTRKETTHDEKHRQPCPRV